MSPWAFYFTAAIFGLLMFWAGYSQCRATMEDEVDAAWKSGHDHGRKAQRLDHAIATRIPLPPDTPSARAPASPGSAAA